MKNKERLRLLKTAKPDYIVYWHFIKGMNKPYEEGYIGVAHVSENGDRWKYGLLKSYFRCAHFFNVIKECGEENIETMILFDGLTKNQANCLEFSFRPYNHIGWNIRQGGGNHGLLSQETKNKISETKRNQVYQYDKIFTQETREKIRLSKLGNTNRLGMHHTEETKRKMAETGKKRILSEKFRNATKIKVVCIETEEVFESIELAKQFAKLKRSDGIGLCCKGKRETAGGYHWRYYDNKSVN